MFVTPYRVGTVLLIVCNILLFFNGLVVLINVPESQEFKKAYYDSKL